MRKIKSVIEATYSNRSDLEIKIEADGAIRLTVWDPEGCDDLAATASIFKQDPKDRRGTYYYKSAQDAINTIDYLVAVEAPKFRENFKAFRDCIA